MRSHTTKNKVLVILFDAGGAYIGRFEFSSTQLYEDFATESVMTYRGGERNTSMPDMRFFTPICKTNGGVVIRLKLIMNGKLVGGIRKRITRMSKESRRDEK